MSDMLSQGCKYKEVNYTQQFSRSELEKARDLNPYDNPVDLNIIKKRALEVASSIEAEESLVIDQIIFESNHSSDKTLYWYVTVKLKASSAPFANIPILFLLDGSTGSISTK